MDQLTKWVLEAWRVEGRSPAYHRQQKENLKRTWPALYAALDALDKGADS